MTQTATAEKPDVSQQREKLKGELRNAHIEFVTSDNVTEICHWWDQGKRIRQELEAIGCDPRKIYGEIMDELKPPDEEIAWQELVRDLKPIDDQLQNALFRLRKCGFSDHIVTNCLKVARDAVGITLFEAEECC